MLHTVDLTGDLSMSVGMFVCPEINTILYTMLYTMLGVSLLAVSRTADRVNKQKKSVKFKICKNYGYHKQLCGILQIK